MRGLPRRRRRPDGDGAADARARRSPRAARLRDPEPLPRAGRRVRGRGPGAMSAGHEQVLEELRRLAAPDGADVLGAAVELLHDRFEDYSWVGIYLVEGDDLVLGPWKGPEATEHVRIPIGEGVCGAAAASGETEIVED